MILVITDNGIEESGSHEELIQNNGAYAELYDQQSEDSLDDNDLCEGIGGL